MNSSFNHALLLAAVFSSLLFSSCNSEDVAPVPNLAVISEDIEVNVAFEDLDNLTLTVLSNAGLSARTNVSIPSGDICKGALINLDESAKKITVDFGEGCTNTSGVNRKGVVTLSYNGNLLFKGAKIITTFQGYEVDGLKIEGSRILLNTGANIEQSTINLDVKILSGKVTWPDASFVTFSSDQERTIKLGAQGEYEASVTGTSSGTSRTGIEYTSATTKALIYTKSCVESGIALPITGIVDFKFLGIESSVDYGDTICDKKATFFYPNGSKQVILD